MPAKKDLTGQKFNKLIVLYEIPKEKRKNQNIVEWECECDCGNHIQVRSSYLTSGHTKSCGCARVDNLKKRAIDITNQHFGKLTALKPTEDRGSDGSIIWQCQCECGNIHYASTNSLKTGAIQSCGCVRSRAEQLINTILFENNINYMTQYWFNDLKDQKYLYFDFAIFNEDKTIKCLIEYQGAQHYQDIAFFNQKYINMNKTHIHDEMKREYCKKNNIRLIEIPYTEENKINSQYLLSLID